MSPQCWHFQPQPLPDLSVGGLWLAFQSTVLQHTGPGVESNSLHPLLCAPVLGFLPFPHPPTQLFLENRGGQPVLGARGLVVMTTHLSKVFMLCGAAPPLSAPSLLCLPPVGQSSPDLETVLPKGQIDSLCLPARYPAHGLLTDCMSD